MNVMQNMKANAKPRKPKFKQHLNFQVVEESNPEQVVNKKVLHEITKDVFGNTTNVNNSSGSNSQVILALTEGRGQARGEVGIAALDVNSPKLIICQISDNLHYSDTLNKLQLLDPVKILLPDTIFETLPISKLIQMIKETFGACLIPVQRRHYNDKQGLELITDLCSRRSNNILQIIPRKYYCLSAASALLSYLKNVSMMTFAKHCLRIEYQTKQGGMMIDTQTSARLELLYSLSTEATAVRKFSLFSILNNCQTRIGQRHLRANILEPSCNIDFIRNRQEQIKVLMEKEAVHATLKENLLLFRSVDQLLKVSCITPAEDCEKAIEVNIQMAILLKQCLEAVKLLAETVRSTVSESFEEARQFLSENIFSEIIEIINQVVQPDIHLNRLAQRHFQHLYAVRGSVNETIDFLRKLYTEATDKIRAYVAELTEQTQLPVKMIHSTKHSHHLYMKCPSNITLPEEFKVISRKGKSVYMTTSKLLGLNDQTRLIAVDLIRISNSILCNMLVKIASNIDVLHYLIGIIIDLDVVQSLTDASNQESYCCPRFDRVMRIEDAFHPMLDKTRNKDDVVTNNVISTPQYNFYLISGPNMSGKTIYIKMIALIQIMAQIGCFVPASNAMLRLTDKIFSRLGFQDSLEQGASSFTVELREMEYINSNLTPNSLVVMDELCRSTNPQEGEQICWNFCEKLLNFIGVSDESYYKESKNKEGFTQTHTNSTLRSKNVKLKDIARPFVFLTTHFTSLVRLSEKFSNAINLHMNVVERIVDEKPRLDYTYKIQSGPTAIKSYGLALARCLRFPTTMLDRAEELIDQIADESIIKISKTTKAVPLEDDDSMDVTDVTQEVVDLDRDVIDLYSYVLLFMSSNTQQQHVNIDSINQKLKQLTDKMSPDLRDLIKNKPLSDIISVLNASKVTNDSRS